MGRYAMPGVWCFKKQLGGCWPGENAPQYVTISLIPEIFNQSLLSPSNMFNVHTHGSFPLRICNFSEASFLALKLKKNAWHQYNGKSSQSCFMSILGTRLFLQTRGAGPGSSEPDRFPVQKLHSETGFIKHPKGSACWLEKVACWTNVLALQKGQNGPLGRVSGIHPSI